MAVSVALLRGINVGGHQKVAMRDLCALFEGLGLQHPRSLLQTGNVIFQGPRRTTASLEQSLEGAVRDRLGVETDVFVRTASEWDEIVRSNPFPKEARAAPNHLLLLCLKRAPAKGAEAALRQAIVGREVVRTAGRQAYVFYTDGIGTSKLTPARIERELDTRATARNWNTVLKIASLLSLSSTVQ